MSVTLLALGIVFIAAGVSALVFGIRINELSLILAGTTALTGGVMMIGVSAVLKKLTLIARALDELPLVPANSGPDARPELRAQLGATPLEPFAIEPRLAEAPAELRADAKSPPAPMADASMT